MLNLAIGELGILSDDFYHKMSFPDFQRRVYYFGKRSDLELKTSWEQTRAIVHVVAAVNGTKGTATDIMPLPWDKIKRSVRPRMLSVKELDVLKRAYKLN